MKQPGAPGTTWRLLRIVELVCFAAALIALGWAAGAYLGTARDQANWASELERQTAHPPEALTPAPRARVAPGKGTVIGRLEVPRLGVSVMTREGVDARTLRTAVGHVPATALPGESGNAAFAGHRDSFFRPLKDIREGDRVVVTTPDGRHEYVVRETRIVKPTDVSVLDRTREPTLTLVTCYPFTYVGAAPQRFIVRAALTKDPAVASNR
jgi:sortase A